MLLATIYWLIVLLANAHFAQVARFSKEFGIAMQTLSIICPSLAKRHIVLRRLKQDFHRRFRARRDERRLSRSKMLRVYTIKSSRSSVTT